MDKLKPWEDLFRVGLLSCCWALLSGQFIRSSLHSGRINGNRESTISLKGVL